MESIWQRLTWPQVVALGLVVAGVVAVLAVVPTEKIVDLPWEQLVGLASVLVGGGIGAFSDRLVRPRSSTAPASVPPPTDVRERRTESPPPPRREGMAHPETLVWILLYALGAGLALAHVLARHAVLVLLVVGAASLTGCGASALRVHASVATTVGAALDVGCEQLAADRTAASDACAAEPTADADAACVAAVRARYAPAVRGCQLAADAHDAWCEGLVEAAAGDDFDLADGLPWVTRALALGVDVVALLAAVGIEVTLPPELAALAGGG